MAAGRSVKPSLTVRGSFSSHLFRVGRTADALAEINEYLRLETNGPFAAEKRTLVDKIKKATPQTRG